MASKKFDLSAYHRVDASIRKISHYSHGVLIPSGTFKEFDLREKEKVIVVLIERPIKNEYEAD